MDEANLEGVIYNSATQWPQGFTLNNETGHDTTSRERGQEEETILTEQPREILDDKMG